MKLPIKLATLLDRLLAAHRHYQAQHQHRMNKMRLAGVQRELAGLEELRKELISAKIEALIDLDESGARVQRLGRAHREAQWTS